MRHDRLNNLCTSLLCTPQHRTCVNNQSDETGEEHSYWYFGQAEEHGFPSVLEPRYSNWLQVPPPWSWLCSSLLRLECVCVAVGRFQSSIHYSRMSNGHRWHLHVFRFAATKQWEWNCNWTYTHAYIYINYIWIGHLESYYKIASQCYNLRQRGHSL